MTSLGTSDIEIAPGYRISHWQKLGNTDQSSTADWEKAITILNRRIWNRFIAPVNALIEIEHSGPRKVFGFATLAIDCLLIETVQGFRDGTTDHTGQSKMLFVKFLRNWRVFGRCIPEHMDAGSLAKRFYTDCRCALHHSGATGSAFRVRVTGPMLRFERDQVEINRLTFHDELRSEFDQYLKLLREPKENALRANMKTKMDFICANRAP